jgi:N-acetylmuramoyl-L-alanine amidase
MARPRASNLPFILAGLMLAGGCSAPATGQSRPAAPAVAPAVPAVPPRAVAVVPPPAAPVSRLWPVKRLYDVDYVDVQAIADRFRLKASWVTSGRVMQLADASGRVRLRFENRDRAFYSEGFRVFMGETTVLSQGSFYVSRIDVIKTIVPLVQPAEYAGQLPAPPRLIVLDAGHGGADPGTRNLVLHLDEKNVTLDVVLRLKKLLERRGYRVILTRSDDTKLAAAQRPDLEERNAIANRAKADLFLSVHFNSAVATVTGTETYVMTPQTEISTGEAKDASVDKAFPGNRQDFANIVLGYHLHRSLLAGLNSADRGFKRSRYMVLEFPDCPAALVEAAYLSNNADASRLATPEFRQRVAQALADGIDEYSAALAALHPSLSGPGETRPAPAASKPRP